ncbi:hypothetical protein NX059_005636 [Plenodomus lindquistii]|nr:hypothetical protein NX059_005636 [Plenodomus lindquistii]
MKLLIVGLALQVGAHAAGCQHLAQAEKGQKRGVTRPSITKTVYNSVVWRMPKVQSNTLQSAIDFGVETLPSPDQEPNQTLKFPDSGTLSRPTGEKPTVMQDTMAGTHVIFGAGGVEPNAEHSQRDVDSSKLPSLVSDDLHNMKLGLVDSRGYISIYIKSVGAVQFCKPVPAERAARRLDEAGTGSVRRLLLETGNTTAAILVRKLTVYKFCCKLELLEVLAFNTTVSTTSKAITSSKQALSPTTILAGSFSMTSPTPESRMGRSVTSNIAYISGESSILRPSTMKSKKSKTATTEIAEAIPTMKNVLALDHANNVAHGGALPSHESALSKHSALAAVSEVSKTTMSAHTPPPARSPGSLIDLFVPAPLYRLPTARSPCIMYKTPYSDDPYPIYTQEQALESTESVLILGMSIINSWYDYISSFMRIADGSDVHQAQTSAQPESSMIRGRNEESTEVRRRKLGVWGAHAEVIRRGSAELMNELHRGDATIETAEYESNGEDGDTENEEAGLMISTTKVDKIVSTDETARKDEAERTRKMTMPTAMINDSQASTESAPLSCDEGGEEDLSTGPGTGPSPDSEINSTLPAKDTRPSSPDEEEDDVLLPPAKVTKSKPPTDDSEDDDLTSSRNVFPTHTTHVPSAPTDTNGDADSNTDLNAPEASIMEQKSKFSCLPSTPLIRTLSSDMSFDFPTPTPPRHHVKPLTSTLSVSFLDLGQVSHSHSAFVRTSHPSRSKSSLRKGVPPSPALPPAPPSLPNNTGANFINGGAGATRWDPSCNVDETAKGCWVAYMPSSDTSFVPEHKKASSAWGIIYDKTMRWTVVLGWGLLGLEIVVGLGEFARGIYGGGVGVGGLGAWVLGWLPRHVPPPEGDQG